MSKPKNKTAPSMPILFGPGTVVVDANLVQAPARNLAAEIKIGNHFRAKGEGASVYVLTVVDEIRKEIFLKRHVDGLAFRYSFETFLGLIAQGSLTQIERGQK